MGRWYLHRIRRLADLAALEQASVVLFVVAALTVGCAASGSSARKAHATNQPGQLGRSMYWAAGGKFIVYEDRGLWVMRADGSHKRRLADGSSRPALSPRGRMLAQLTGTPEELGGRHLIFRTVGTRVGRPVRTFRLRLAPSDDFYSDPSWAPDESAVAFRTRAGIFVADLRSGVRLIDRRITDFGSAWSPDSRRIAVSSCPQQNRCKLMVMSREGTRRRRVVGTSSGISPFAWSPDGRRLAFSRPSGIYVVRPNGSGLRRVASKTASELAWSPDNKRLAYIGPDGISVLDVAGGRPRLITTKKDQVGLA